MGSQVQKYQNGMLIKAQYTLQKRIDYFRDAKCIFDFRNGRNEMHERSVTSLIFYLISLALQKSKMKCISKKMRISAK